MIKKIISMALVAVMCLSFNVFAEGTEHVVNGSFENWPGGGAPYGWGLRGGVAGSTFLKSKKEIHGGSFAVCFKPDGTSAMYLTQSITTFIPGEKYVFKGFVKVVERMETGPAITLDFYDAENKQISRVITGFADAPLKKWTEVKHSFTVPKDTVRTTFLLRMVDTKGEIYWDDVSIEGKGGFDAEKAERELMEQLEEERRKNPPPVYIEMPDFSKELITNAGFETGSATGVNDWHPYGGKWADNPHVSLSDEEVHSGKKSLKITTTENNSPWAYQNIDGEFIEPDALYQVSAWVNIKVGNQIGFKLEWYDEEGNGIGGSALTMDGPTDGFEHFISYFKPPVECASFKLYVRIYSIGTVYYDDVSFYKIEKAPIYALNVETDEVFFYSDMKEGNAYITLNSKDFPDIGEGTVDFAIKDGEKAVFEVNGAKPVDNKAEFKFPLSVLSELGKEYEAVATAKDKDGRILGVEAEKIMKYKRPKMLDRDGNILDENGNLFYPVFAYHVRPTEIQYVVEAGVNVVQSTNQERAYLDEAEKHGVKVLVRLYPDMKPAAHPDNIEQTKKVVNELKDHPALFGWMVMDEPTLYYPNSWELFYDSYKLIRDLDPDHVIYMVQDSTSGFDVVGKYVDILSLDPYPADVNKLSKVGDFTKKASEAVDYNKAVWCLNQAFLWNKYFPNISEYRNMWYQALFAGAQGVGFYAFYNAYSDGTVKKNLNETELWPGMVEFAEKELKESYEYFLDCKYPVFNFGREEDYWWHSFVKNDEVYMIVLNLRNIDKSISIPLESNGKSVKINGYTAEVIYGGEGKKTSQGDTLNIDIKGNAALVYKITPNAKPDYSKLAALKYRDMENHAWAAEEVAYLRKLDIVNDITPGSFGPDKNITRGDLAYFLIRSLGISSESEENFDDVPLDSYYAKEIAAGKAAGIIKGMGDGTFRPEDEITRQDLMVICSGGLNLGESISPDYSVLDSFGDKEQISDYAKDHVAFMVEKGLVKGDTAAQINPVGNATRAEAAMIIHRILNERSAK